MRDAVSSASMRCSSSPVMEGTRIIPSHGSVLTIVCASRTVQRRSSTSLTAGPRIGLSPWPSTGNGDGDLHPVVVPHRHAQSPRRVRGSLDSGGRVQRFLGDGMDDRIDHQEIVPQEVSEGRMGMVLHGRSPLLETTFYASLSRPSPHAVQHDPVESRITRSSNGLGRKSSPGRGRRPAMEASCRHRSCRAGAVAPAPRHAAE